MTDCSNHICPDCKVEFSHEILYGDVCLDMMKRLRCCDDCVAKARLAIEQKAIQRELQAKLPL